jgi:hypothetical protein
MAYYLLVGEGWDHSSKLLQWTLAHVGKIRLRGSVAKGFKWKLEVVEYSLEA